VIILSLVSKEIMFYGSKSALIGKSEIERALEITLSMFPFLCDEKHSSVAITILDPIKVRDGVCLSDAIMCECLVNAPIKKYIEIAENKANVCLKNGGHCNHYIQQFQPYLLESGDTKYSGGMNYDGWIVTASGLKWNRDELLSWVMVGVLISIAKEKMEEVMNDGERINL